MKVLQLGVGSVGEVIARTIAREPEISTVVLADIDAAARGRGGWGHRRQGAAP